MNDDPRSWLTVAGRLKCALSSRSLKPYAMQKMCWYGRNRYASDRKIKSVKIRWQTGLEKPARYPDARQ